MFVIEHLEPVISKWLFIEYMHASTIVGKDKLVFTNVKNPRDREVLSKLGFVRSESSCEIFSPNKVIILDPKASEKLKPEDFIGKDAVIIGGILGDHPPKGRTHRFITSKFVGAFARNIGEGQFSIDGAVYVAKLVSEGSRLENIPVKRGLTIKLNERAEIHLPYVYPIKNGKPLMHENLIKYLVSEEIVRDEEKLLREGNTETLDLNLNCAPKSLNG